MTHTLSCHGQWEKGEMFLKWKRKSHPFSLPTLLAVRGTRHSSHPHQQDCCYLVYHHSSLCGDAADISLEIISHCGFSLFQGLRRSVL